MWEKIKEFNFGVDFAVLQNRINITADAYRRLADGQIMKSTVPLETGESSLTTNIGSVQNAGIELGVNFGVIRNQNFTWDVNVAFARNWSKIKRTAERRRCQQQLVHRRTPECTARLHLCRCNYGGRSHDAHYQWRQTLYITGSVRQIWSQESQ